MPFAPPLNRDDFRELTRQITATYKPQPAALAAGMATVVENHVVSAGEAPAVPSLAADDVYVVGAPSAYRLTQWKDSGEDWTAVNDRLELDIHGAASMTHIDTVEHFSWTGASPNARGAGLEELARGGIMGRGVLVDVPGVLGVDVAGRPITLPEVLETVARSGIEFLPGDALYFSFGRSAPAQSNVPLGSVPSSGLSIECAEWLASLQPSVVVTDEGMDPVPSEVDGLITPWHILILTVMGVPLVDRATLQNLAAACEARKRWTFLSVIVPLPIALASGSPVNPLAVF